MKAPRSFDCAFKVAPTFPVHEPIQNTMKGRFQIDLVHGALQRGFCRLGPLRNLTEGLTAKHRPGLDEAFGSMTKTNWAAFSQDHAFPATPAKNTERFLASTMDLAVSGTSQNMILVKFFVAWLAWPLAVFVVAILPARLFVM